MNIFSPDEMRRIEENANASGLSYEKMMLTAGKGCAEKIMKHAPGRKKTLILCGKGKNGGDGFVIAGVLASHGFDVQVVRMFACASDPLSEKVFAGLPSAVKVISFPDNEKSVYNAAKEAEVIVDAVFGIGFSGQLPEAFVALFRFIDKVNAVKFAVDIPSGLVYPDENTLGTCFRADRTLTMHAMKKEQIYKPYSMYCGKTSVIPIGITDGEPSEVFSHAVSEIRKILPERPYNANKGTFGHALIVAGSYNMPGAAVIAAKGALSMGAGLVTLAFPDCCYTAVTSQLSENIMLPLRTADDGTISRENARMLVDDADKYSAAAIGCGITTSKDAGAVLSALIKNYPGTLIIDADGINLLSKNIDVLKDAVGKIVLTPHPAEMSRITWLSVDRINTSREKTASDFAKEYKVTLLLKGPNTVVAAQDGRIYVNPTGSTALSRGGSGDMLTGMITSLAAQGLEPFEAACTAAFIHGLAGEKAEKKYTSYAASTSRIIDSIPDALSQILNRPKA